jgi:ATP-dependent protease ClpP protease subunit
MINLFGVVGADIKASEVMREIQAYQGDIIEVVINSVGGSVYEGMAIYGALKNDPRPVKTTILGIGASIASVIFMAGDEREISDGSQIMIHNALAPNAGGNKYEMAEAIERLEQIDSDMKKIYSGVTGLQNDILEAMLEKETFLNADEALKLGFATSKAGAQELVAMYNEKQEETAMAELDKEEMSFLQGIFAKLGFGAKAESDEVSEPVAEVAEEEEEEKAEEPAEEVEAMDEEHEEEAEKAEDEEEEAKDDSEVEALKARVDELEIALEAKLDKEAEAKKQDLVFEAIKDNKLTLAQGKDMIAMSVEDVEASLEVAKENSTGYGEGETPEEIVNMWDKYKAISDPAERSAFYQANMAQIKKDKLK